MNRYRVKEIGKTISGGKSADENISLQGSKFQIGDFMDIAIRVREILRIGKIFLRKNAREGNYFGNSLVD